MTIAAGDFDGDGKDELVLSAMRFNDDVRVFKYDNGAFTQWKNIFDAYGPYNEGLNVAAGDFDGNGQDELVLSAMRFNDHVQVFKYENGNFVMTGNLFDVYGPYNEGVNVAAGDFDGNGKDELVLSSMRFNDNVQVFQYENGSFTSFGSIYDNYGNYFEGVFVAAGDFDISIARNVEEEITFDTLKDINANNFFINHALPASWAVKAPFLPSVANPFTTPNPDIAFENKDYDSPGYVRQTDEQGDLLVGADGQFKARLANNQGNMFVKITGRFNVQAPQTYAVEYSSDNGNSWMPIETSKFILPLSEPTTLAYWNVKDLKNGAFLLRATLDDEEVYRIPVTLGEKITRVAGGTVNSPYKHVQLEVPPNVIKNTQYVTLYSRPDITLPQGTNSVGEVYELSPSLTQADFLQPARVKFYWKDANNDGIVDDTNASENTLRIYRYDLPSLLTALPVVRLDAQNNFVEAELDHFSFFVLMPVSDETPPEITGISALPATFSPNGDGKKDTTLLFFYVSEDAMITVTVTGASGNTVRSLYSANRSQGTQAVVWDGRDDDGFKVGDGTYTLKVEARDSAGNMDTASAVVVIDTVKPVASVVQVAPTEFSPNNDGLADTVTFSYTLSEAGYVTADIIDAASSIVYRFFVTPKLQPAQLQNVTWDGTGNTGEGPYRIRLQVEDFAGNASSFATAYVFLDFGPPEIKNVSVSPDPFSPNNATSTSVKDTTLITADIVETGNVTWSLTLKDTSNAPVVSFTGTTKQIQQVWDGKNSSGNFVSDGVYAYSIQASDATGNTAEKSGSISVDNTNPQTILTTGTPLFEADGKRYITSATPLTLSATDPVVNGFASGISYTHYRIDGGAFVSYTGSSFSMTEGIHTVEYQSLDNVGNTESAKSEIFYVDNTPSVTSLSTGEPKYQTADKVYVTPNTPITLTAGDPVTASVSSGVSRIEFKIDSGNFTSYTTAITLSEGVHTVSFRSVDNVGNTETENSQVYSVDSTPPVTTLTPSAPLFNALYAPLSTTYALSAIDPVSNNVSSGVMKIVYQIDGGAEAQYTQPIALTEGEHTITYYAKDNVLNTETPKSFTVRVDNTASVTQFVPSSPFYANQYAPLSTTYTFTATDPVSSGVASGVAKIQYTLDGGVLNTFNGNPIVLTEGIHTFVYYATDNVQNIESQKTVTVYVDNTPPATSITVGVPQYASGGKLYVSEKTTLSLTAFDPVAQNVSSGVSVIQYRMDGENWNTYVSPFTLPEGVRLVEYRSLDNVQNTENAQSITLHVDGTVPETALSIGTPQCTVYANPVVTYATPFTLTPVDPVKNNVASGVNFTQYRLNNGNWQTYTGSFTIPTSFSDGTITVDYRSQDNVENLESIKTQVVILDNASPATQILSPQANSYTNNTIAVVGVVTDTYFSDKGYYTVEYGSGSSPSSFATIQPAMYEQRNCSVDNPTCTPLTYWNTSTVTQNQIYTVRLSTQDCVGNATSTQVSFKVGEPPFVLSFGTKSQGQQPNNGEFNEPAGLAGVIANDGTENIAVSDKQNHRVQIFTDKGQFITKFGQKAHGQVDGGEFNEPTEIVTDSSGNLYVVDSLDDRVQKFNSTYAFIAAFGSHGSGAGQFNKPYGVARDAQGNLYITDMQNNRVQKLDANGNFIKEWTAIKKTTNGVDEFLIFNKPGGILGDAAGNLYVSDSQNDRILKFTQDGTLLLSIEATGQTQTPSSYGDHPLKQPLGLSLDNFGNLYVADQMNHRVQKFDPWGFRLLNFGTKTQGNQNTDGTFNQVADVLLDSTQKFIYVSDIYNHRVQRFAITVDAPPVAKLASQKNDDKNAIISDPNLLNVLKVVSYPTPSRGKLSFNLEAEGNVTQITLEVYTMNGKRVLTEYLPVMAATSAKGKGKFKAESPSLDAVLNTLPNGVYVYRLKISNGVKTVNKTGKFVVVR